MLTIRNEQLDELEGIYSEIRNQKIWEEVKSIFPDLCSQDSDIKGLKVTSEAVDDAKDINITKFEDLVKFVGMAFLPKEILGDPWISSILIRILNKVEKSASERLEFLYKHVLPQNISGTTV